MENTENQKIETQKNNNLLMGGVILIVILGIIAFIGTKKMNTNEETTNPAINAELSTENFNSAVIVTNLGQFEITFLKEKAPHTVNNFIKLAESKFYENIKFHRVIKDFMIQTGDPLSRDSNEMFYGTGGPGYYFDDEITDVKLARGIVAMANAGPNTNGSQFFVITAPETPWIQGNHTAFAKVASGMDVVDKISAVRTKINDIPIEPVIIEKIILK